MTNRLIHYKSKNIIILCILLFSLCINEDKVFGKLYLAPIEDTLQYMPDDDEYNLVIASLKGDYHLVESLITKNINPNTALDETFTPLNYAARGGQLKICNYLISKGAEVNFRPANGATPLIGAVRYKQYHIVDFLIDKGADINMGDENGRTPLMYTIINADTALFDKFIKANCNINQKDTTGIDALMCAIINNQPYFAEELLNLGIQANTCDDMGTTPIMIATGAGNLQLIDLLLKYKADINQKSRNKQTPLVIAIENKDEILIQNLIDRGANVNQQLTIIETPLLVANYFDCNGFVIESLTSKNAKMSFLPDYRKFIIGPEISFNIDEFMSGISFGMKDYRYNSDIYFGFLIRPLASRIRVPVEGKSNEYYQYWERRSYFFLGITKKIALVHKANDFQRGIFIGCKGLATFSDYRGTDLSTTLKYIPAPELGIYQSNKYFQVCMSYMYADYKTEGVSNHKLNLTFKFFIGRAFNFSIDEYRSWK